MPRPPTSNPHLTPAFLGPGLSQPESPDSVVGPHSSLKRTGRSKGSDSYPPRGVSPNRDNSLHHLHHSPPLTPCVPMDTSATFAAVPHPSKATTIKVKRGSRRVSGELQRGCIAVRHSPLLPVRFRRTLVCLLPGLPVAYGQRTYSWQKGYNLLLEGRPLPSGACSTARYAEREQQSPSNAVCRESL